MDAISRISSYWPFKTLTSYFIISNIIINDSGYCEPQQRQLMIALLVIFSILNFVACFTDTYTATNQQKFWVVILPFYGPVCFSLPSDFDKDRVYEFYYLKIRDYIHALLSTSAFLLVSIFSNPICMCLFPSSLEDGTSKFDASIIRTVPIIVAVITALVMVCLGPPRQVLGFQNVTETCPPLEAQMGNNPIYRENKYPPGVDPSIPEGEEEGDMDHEFSPHSHPGPAPHMGGPPSSKYSSRDYGNQRPNSRGYNGGNRGGPGSHRDSTPPPDSDV